MAQQAGDVLVIAGLVVYLGLSLSYGLGAPWWRTQIGINYLMLPVALVLFFGLAALTVIAGVDWKPRPWVRAGVLGAIVAIGAWRTLIVVTLQLRSKSRKREPDHEAHH